MTTIGLRPAKHVNCRRRSSGNYLATSIAVRTADPSMSAFALDVLVENRNRGFSGSLLNLLLTDDARRELIVALGGVVPE